MICEDWRSLGQDLNTKSPEYEVRVRLFVCDVRFYMKKNVLNNLQSKFSGHEIRPRLYCTLYSQDGLFGFVM
jgi:hypothetical protein